MYGSGPLLRTIEPVLRPSHKGVLRNQWLINIEGIIANLRIAIRSADIADNAPLRREVARSGDSPRYLVVLLQILARAEAEISATTGKVPRMRVRLLDIATDTCLPVSVFATAARTA